MLENPVCRGLAKLAVDCDAPVLLITVWHLIIIGIVFITVTSFAWAVRRYRRLDQHANLLEMTAPYRANGDANTLRVHPHEFAQALGLREYEADNKTTSAKKLNEIYGKRYFVVEIREFNKTIFRKELQIIAWPYVLGPTEFQVDAFTLRKLKLASSSKIDDDTSDSVGLDGRFDLFFRPVYWWDFRHWLNHPSREIRYALYVGLFAAFLEYSADLVELVKAIT